MNRDAGSPITEVPLAARRVFLSAALRFAAASRRVVRRRLARGFTARLKPDGSFVTDADLEAERVLRAAIARRFPEHGIVGEEFAPTRPRSDFRWLLDPIDGTLSFTRGIPLWGTIVALHYKGRPLVGVIDHPALGECYSAAAGLGAWRDGSRIRLPNPRADTAIDDHVIATGDRSQYLRCGRQAAFDRLLRRHPRVRTYADCFGHTLAVRGAVGATVDFGVRSWDIGASRVLIEEAGGKYVENVLLEEAGTPPFYGVALGKPAVVDWLTGVVDLKP